MAEQHGERWYPDRYTIGSKKLLLDPSKTWQENVFYFIDVTVAIWLARAGVWAYDKELIEELEQECRVRTYLYLRDIVCRKKYNTACSFYCNVRGCAWACVSNCIGTWKHRHIDISNKLVSLDTPVTSQNNEGDELTIGDSIASHEARRLRTDYDIIKDCDARHSRRLTLDDVEIGQPGYPRVWYAVTEAEWDNYLQSCSEFGLEPISKEEFIQKNFPPPGRTKSERELHRAELGHKYWLEHKDDPVWREKHRASCRQRYYRRKAKQKEQGG